MSFQTTEESGSCGIDPNATAQIINFQVQLCDSDHYVRKEKTINLKGFGRGLEDAPPSRIINELLEYECVVFDGDDLRSDRRNVFEAVSSNGMALQWASPELRDGYGACPPAAVPV